MALAQEPRGDCILDIFLEIATVTVVKDQSEMISAQVDVPEKQQFILGLSFVSCVQVVTTLAYGKICIQTRDSISMMGLAPAPHYMWMAHGQIAGELSIYILVDVLPSPGQILDCHVLPSAPTCTPPSSVHRLEG